MAKISRHRAVMCLMAQIRGSRALQIALCRQIWFLSRSNGYASIDEITEFLRSSWTDACRQVANNNLVVYQALMRVIDYTHFVENWDECNRGEWFVLHAYPTGVRGLSLTMPGVLRLIKVIGTPVDEHSLAVPGFLRLGAQRSMEDSSCEKQSFDINDGRIKRDVLLTLLEEVAISSHEQGWVSIDRFAEALRERLPWIRGLINVDTVIGCLVTLGNFVSHQGFRYIGARSLVRVSDAGIEFLIGPALEKPEPKQIQDLYVYFSASEQRIDEFLRLVAEMSERYANWVPYAEITKVVQARYPVECKVNSSLYALVAQLKKRRLLETGYVNIGHPGPSRQRAGTRPRLSAVSLTSEGRGFLKVAAE